MPAQDARVVATAPPAPVGEPAARATVVARRWAVVLDRHAPALAAYLRAAARATEKDGNAPGPNARDHAALRTTTSAHALLALACALAAHALAKHPLSDPTARAPRTDVLEQWAAPVLEHVTTAAASLTFADDDSVWADPHAPLAPRTAPGASVPKALVWLLSITAAAPRAGAATAQWLWRHPAALRAHALESASGLVWCVAPPGHTARDADFGLDAPTDPTRSGETLIAALVRALASSEAAAVLIQRPPHPPTTAPTIEALLRAIVTTAADPSALFATPTDPWKPPRPLLQFAHLWARSLPADRNNNAGVAVRVWAHWAHSHKNSAAPERARLSACVPLLAGLTPRTLAVHPRDQIWAALIDSEHAPDATMHRAVLVMNLVDHDTTARALTAVLNAPRAASTPPLIGQPARWWPAQTRWFAAVAQWVSAPATDERLWGTRGEDMRLNVAMALGEARPEPTAPPSHWNDWVVGAARVATIRPPGSSSHPARPPWPWLADWAATVGVRSRLFPRPVLCASRTHGTDAHIPAAVWHNAVAAWAGEPPAPLPTDGAPTWDLPPTPLWTHTDREAWARLRDLWSTAVARAPEPAADAAPTIPPMVRATLSALAVAGVLLPMWVCAQAESPPSGSPPGGAGDAPWGRWWDHLRAALIDAAHPEHEAARCTAAALATDRAAWSVVAAAAEPTASAAWERLQAVIGSAAAESPPNPTHAHLIEMLIRTHRSEHTLDAWTNTSWESWGGSEHAAWLRARLHTAVRDASGRPDDDTTAVRHRWTAALDAHTRWAVDRGAAPKEVRSRVLKHLPWQCALDCNEPLGSGDGMTAVHAATLLETTLVHLEAVDLLPPLIDYVAALSWPPTPTAAPIRDAVVALLERAALRQTLASDPTGEAAGRRKM